MVVFDTLGLTTTLNVDGTSEVFFLQENRDGNYEIFFGNDSIGKKLEDGSTITVTYLVTNGPDSNKANNFVHKTTLTDSNGDATSISITPVSSASGGSDKESVDSIKFSAPNQFTTQNRLVTRKDYEATILREVLILRPYLFGVVKIMTLLHFFISR